MRKSEDTRQTNSSLQTISVSHSFNNRAHEQLNGADTRFGISICLSAVGFMKSKSTAQLILCRSPRDINFVAQYEKWYILKLVTTQESLKKQSIHGHATGDSTRTSSSLLDSGNLSRSKASTTNTTPSTVPK